MQDQSEVLHIVTGTVLCGTGSYGNKPLPTNLFFMEIMLLQDPSVCDELTMMLIYINEYISAT